MNWRQLTLAHYAAAISTVAIVLSGGSAYYAKRSYDLNAIRDQREVMEKRPAVDVQMHPAGLSNLSVKISIINRTNTNIMPLDMEAEHSFDAGALYFSNNKQSIDQLNSILSLTSMGTIAPNGRGTAIATLSGITDGKLEQFQTGVELEFIVRIRLADEQDTVENIRLVRRILPRPKDRHQFEPTPQMFLTTVQGMQRAYRNQRIIIFALVGFSLVGAVAYFFLPVRPGRGQSCDIKETVASKSAERFPSKECASDADSKLG